VPSPATFDYQKLDWLNGVYLRNLQPDEYAHWLCKWLRERGIDWPTDLVHATVPLVEEKIETFAQYPDFVRFLFEDVNVDGADPRICQAAYERLEPVEPWEATRLEEELRALADELGEKPRTAFQPIRLAITGAKISPGLFESLELLGKEKSLARLHAAYGR
jgi:glutamyl-tRNA synthetase